MTIRTRAIFAASTILLVTGFAARGADDPPTLYAGAKPGPLAVAQADEVRLRDDARDKDLRVIACFPEEEGSYPTIVFSHGAGGSGRNVLALPRSWASHGYVVLLPTHADSLALRKLEAVPDAGGPAPGLGLRGLVGSVLADAQGWQDRPLDVTFLLDHLDTLQEQVPGLKGKPDPARIGVGGHSLGAYTAQLIGGATVDLPGGPKARSFADDRVRAILMLSGQGSGQQGLTEHSWDDFRKPLMSITGSLDRGAKGQGPEWRKEPFEHVPPGDKYHLLIAGAHHGSFTGNFAGGASARLRERMAGRPGADRPADQAAIFDYVQAATLAYWDATLKDDPEARAYLRSDALPAASGGAVDLSRR